MVADKRHDTKNRRQKNRQKDKNDGIFGYILMNS